MFLLFCVLDCPPAASSESSSATEGPPDTDTVPTSLLLITVDTTRADHIGCYGASLASTPNLDTLCRNGVWFETALSPAPLTLPSHATMMTGLTPRNHGVRNNSLFRLEERVPVLAETLREAGLHTAAFVSAAVLDRRTGLDRGFEHYDDTVRIGDRAAFNYVERGAGQTTDAALEYLTDLGPPFFLWVHYFDPHLPYVPPEPYRTRFEERPYDGEIAFMDREIGRLLKAVGSKAGPLLVAVAGDHGESLGEHQEDAHGVFVYQATQRVPLILSGPGLPSGRVVSRNVGLVDLAPTLLDLLGLPPIGGADGMTLAPSIGRAPPEPQPTPQQAEAARGGSASAAGRRNGTIHGDDKGLDEEVAPTYEMESFFPRFAYGWSPLRALIRGSLKYIDAPEPELYDLATDPDETRNVYLDREETARGLRAALLQRVGDDDPGAPRVDPDLAEQRRRLEALGYVGGTGASDEAAPDPKSVIGLVRELDAARRALQTGDPRTGIPTLERLLTRNPDNVPALLTLAQCHLRTGNANEAIVLDRRALELSPDDDLVHFNLANALAMKARRSPETLGEARAAYERALELNPRYADAYLNYASLLIERDSPEAARQLLQRARAAGVQDPDIELELGLLELKRGERGSARAALERAVALNPCAEGVHEALGRLAYGEGDFERSSRHYEGALACRPSADLAKTLGSIFLYDLADRGRARAAYEMALELAPPDDPDVATLRELLADLEQVP